MTTRDTDDQDLLEMLGDQLAVLVLQAETEAGRGDTVAVINEKPEGGIRLEALVLEDLLRAEHDLVVIHPRLRSPLGVAGARYAVINRACGRSSLLLLQVDMPADGN